MDFYKCNTEVLSAISKANSYIEKTREQYLSKDYILASDRFVNFVRTINIPEHKFDNYSIKISVYFDGIKDKINWEDYIYVQVIISLIDEKFKSAKAFTGHTVYLNIVSEMLDTLEVEVALAKLCDSALEILDILQNDFQYNKAGDK